METLRKRAPFRPSDGDESEEDEKRILDEQEQDTLIQQLKLTNKSSSRQYLAILQTILVLSFVLQVLSFYKNPLLVMVPPTIPDPSIEIPLSAAFTLLNIIVHINLTLIAFHDELMVRYHLSEAALNLLPYQLAYAIAAVPVTLSTFLQKSWQSTAWWGVAVLMVFTVHAVMTAIDQGDKGISELESLRYVSPGA